MKRSAFYTLLCCLSLHQARGNDGTPRVTVSIQPVIGSVPVYVAIQEGYFDYLGIEIETVLYPSGNQQIRDAVEQQESWDIGYAGVIPNIIGGGQGILSIGIANDQSAINQLVATAAGAALWPPETFANLTIAVTANSTAQYVVQSCLVESGYELSDVTWIYEAQPAVLEALSPTTDAPANNVFDDKESSTITRSGASIGTPPSSSSSSAAQFGGLWAPNTYKFFAEHEDDATMICHAGSAYKTVTGGIMARQDFAESHPALVAQVLAAWMRAFAFLKDERNRNKVLDYMAAFFNDNDDDDDETIPRQALAENHDQVGIFTLSEQIDLMRRDGGGSVYDFWTLQVSEFMVRNGILSTYPDPVDYITDEYLLRIERNPRLRAFAMGEDLDVVDNLPSSRATSHSAGWIFSFLLGLATAIGCLW